MLSAAFTLISPNLPIGGFSYSEGLEAAVSLGEIDGYESFAEFLRHNLKRTLALNDLPLLIRLYEARDPGAFARWTARAVALRTTLEARSEERDKGRALTRLMRSLRLEVPEELLAAASRSYLSACALFARLKGLSQDILLESYGFAFIEAQAMAAIKLVPIGQTQAWRLIDELSGRLRCCAETARGIADDEIGGGQVNLALLSVLHETQYSRIFRS